MLKRVIVLCEESKLRFAYPTAFVLQSCGREVYLVNDIDECVEKLKMINQMQSDSVSVVFPLMLDYDYSVFGWSCVRKDKIIGLDYFLKLKPHLSLHPISHEILTRLYVVSNSRKQAKIITDLMDCEGAMNHLVLKGCSVVETYKAAGEKIIFDDSMRTSSANLDVNNQTLEIGSSSTTVALPIPSLFPIHRIVFVRHAERLDEVNPHWADLAERPQDTPITSKGVIQATCSGNWIASQSWAGEVISVYASPFVRTVRTADIIADQLGYGSKVSPVKHKIQNPRNDTSTQECLIKIENGLCEDVDWMAINGKPKLPWLLRAADLCCVSEQIDLSYNSATNPVLEKGDVYPGRPVEIGEFYDRCASCVWRLVRRSPNEEKSRTIIAVSHASSIINMVHALTGKTILVKGTKNNTHVPSGYSMRPTCITSVVLNTDTGEFDYEQDQDDGGDLGNYIVCSVKHLPSHVR